MLFGPNDIGTLELRASPKGRGIRGRFPYNRRAVLSDGGKTGKPRKEEFKPGAFKYSLEHIDDSPIHLLSGHSYDKPLASTANGTLQLTDTPDALTFDAEITPQVAQISWVVDLFALMESGLSVGLSPGFRIPPERAVPAKEAEQITQEAYDPSKGMFGAIIRSILQAILFELSVVTRPAYDQAQVEARNWEVTESGLAVPKPQSILRYR